MPIQIISADLCCMEQAAVYAANRLAMPCSLTLWAYISAMLASPDWDTTADVTWCDKSSKMTHPNEKTST